MPPNPEADRGPEAAGAGPEGAVGGREGRREAGRSGNMAEAGPGGGGTRYRGGFHPDTWEEVRRGGDRGVGGGGAGPG